MNLGLYLRTIKYLKPRQIFYRIFYVLRKKTGQAPLYNEKLIKNFSTNDVTLKEFIKSPDYVVNKTYKFVNLEKKFETPDWGFNEYGKLWQYNLHYFEYINSSTLSVDESIGLILDFIKNIKEYPECIEPYPTSLRIVNWIKFIAANKDSIPQELLKIINRSLFIQSLILSKNKEYHIMGNHLLENGLALLFSAVYFNSGVFLNHAVGILNTELDEQILDDGAHFELSPMYHRVILERMLDCYNILVSNNYTTHLTVKIKTKLEIMLGWLKNMTYKDGSTPLFNDGTVSGVKSSELLAYAGRLGINAKIHELGDSGYRKFITEKYEVFADAGKIGPDYIPGHSHCDILSFEMHIDSKPFIVDTGTSTYETSALRLSEKSTSAHNTVSLGGLEQSELWGSFRVGKRAYPKIIEDNQNNLIAEHNGFSDINAVHRREFIKNDDFFEYEDFTNSPSLDNFAYLHFHPDIELTLYNNDSAEKWIFAANRAIIELSSNENLYCEIKNFDYAPDMNIRVKSSMLVIKFKSAYKCRIMVKQ